MGREGNALADGHFLFLIKSEIPKVLSKIKGPDPVEDISSRAFV